MKSAKVFDVKGKEIDKKSLNPEVFEIEANENLLKQAVVRYLASLREPIAKTKTRGERRGGGKKPWKQKGTGRARVGSRRSPIWRKGGIIFGPTGIENFTKKMPKKAIKKAILMALSKKAKEDRVFIIDGVKPDKPNTKKAKELFDLLPVSGRILLVSGKDPVLSKSVSNIPYIYLSEYNQLNTYDILVADYIIIINDVLEKITSTYNLKIDKSAKKNKEKTNGKSSKTEKSIKESK